MLAVNPFCAWPGCSALATQDDHIVPWSQRGAWTYEEWDHPSNHQGLCVPHHKAKTQRESLAGRQRRRGQP